MNKYAFLTEPARRGTEMTEGYGRRAAAGAKYCEPQVAHRVNRYRNLDKGFSLTIRADDGSNTVGDPRRVYASSVSKADRLVDQ